MSKKTEGYHYTESGLDNVYLETPPDMAAIEVTP